MSKRMFVALLAVAAAVGGCEEREAGPDPGELRATAPSSETFRAAVDAVLPAVVYVEVQTAGQRGRRAFPFPRSPGGPPGGPPGGAPGEPAVGAGSGVIFSSDGYILTSNHVVRQAGAVQVTLHDRRQFEARVVARDPSTDVAVVKIESEDLPTATFGDSEALATGDWVLAVGSPLGLLFTATAGIVSAKGRQLGIIGAGAQGGALRAAPLEHFIQTDAAINPGNSGGPLINLAGRVVGINTAIVSPTGVFAGIGFAVPIDLARAVASDLIEHGEVRRPFLGVVLEDVSAADAEVYGLPAATGAEIVSVQPGSPAAEAGLRVGDVVVGIDGEKVENVGGLQAALAKLEPRGTAALEVVRGGERGRVQVELGVVRSGVTPEPEPETEPAPEPAPLGFGVRERDGEVVVTTVNPTSPALAAGLRAGQRVLSVNGRPVGSAEEFAAAVRAIDGDVISVELLDPDLGRTIVNYRVGR